MVLEDKRRIGVIHEESRRGIGPQNVVCRRKSACAESAVVTGRIYLCDLMNARQFLGLLNQHHHHLLQVPGTSASRLDCEAADGTQSAYSRARPCHRAARHSGSKV